MFRLIRLTARALGALVLLVSLVSFLGQGPPGFSAMTTREALGSLAVGIGVAGLIVAWWWEGIGGALALTAFVLHAVASRRVSSGGLLWLVPVIGIMFLAVWWARRRGMDSGPDPAPLGGPLTPRLAGRIASGVAAALVAWLAVEMVLPTTPITSRVASVPAVAGRWEGKARFVEEWGPPGELTVVLSVNGDGTVEGTIGAASFRNAPLVPNRSWLGSLFHIRSDYRLKGGISGVITPRFAIECAAFSLPLSLGSETLDGRLTSLACTRGGKKQGNLHSTLIAFRKPVPRKR